MKAADAIHLILNMHPDCYIVSTCGYTSRDLFNCRDREENFYMVGSMGMAAPVALGLALCKPDKKIVVLDGDGSFLMNLGICPMVGQQQPPNLIHVVLDNGMHESTGGQATVRLERIAETARVLGYRNAISVTQSDQWVDFERGPTLIHIKTDPRTETIGQRVTWTPQEIVSRFTNSLGGVGGDVD